MKSQNFSRKTRVKPYCVCKERVRTQNAPQKCVCTCIGWAGYRSWGYSCRRHTCSLFVCTAGEWVSLRVWPQSPSCVACIWKKIITLIFFLSFSMSHIIVAHWLNITVFFFHLLISNIFICKWQRKPNMIIELILQQYHGEKLRLSN